MDWMQDDTGDSGIDSNYTSEMESVTSENYEFRHRAGRRVHGIIQSPYPLPNDDEEVIRLDEQHYVFKFIFGRNVLAPISRKATNIVDVGTGSGRWAIEVADEYPTARVIGMDLSPIQPTQVPLNCEFMVGNLTGDLEGFNEGSMDLVHSRLVRAGIREDEWPKYVADVFRILKPGNGWAQFAEAELLEGDDRCIPESGALAKFKKLIPEYWKSEGVVATGTHLKQRFIDAGFERIHVVRERLYMGNWIRDTGHKGRIWKLYKDTAMAKVIPALATLLNEWLPENERSPQFASDVTAEFRNNDYPLYTDMTIVIGRKPAMVTSKVRKK